MHRFLTVVITIALAACTSAYDTDDLRGDGGATGADGDAGAIDGGGGNDGGGGIDAAPPADAAPDIDGAPAACGIVGDDCEGDPFLECTASGECAECGGNGQVCCVSGDKCRNLGLTCVLGSNECGIL
jgi:hypothetical protein